MNEESPRVYGEGEVSLFINSRGLCMYVGVIQIEFIEQITLSYQGQKTELSVSFVRSSDPTTQLKIDGHIRLVKAVPWIKVLT